MSECFQVTGGGIPLEIRQLSQELNITPREKDCCNLPDGHTIVFSLWQPPCWRLPCRLPCFRWLCMSHRSRCIGGTRWKKFCQSSGPSGNCSWITPCWCWYHTSFFFFFFIFPPCCNIIWEEMLKSHLFMWAFVQSILYEKLYVSVCGCVTFHPADPIYSVWTWSNAFIQIHFLCPDSYLCHGLFLLKMNEDLSTNNLSNKLEPDPKPHWRQQKLLLTSVVLQCPFRASLIPGNISVLEWKYFCPQHFLKKSVKWLESVEQTKLELYCLDVIRKMGADLENRLCAVSVNIYRFHFNFHEIRAGALWKVSGSSWWLCQLHATCLEPRAMELLSFLVGRWIHPWAVGSWLGAP